MPKFAANLTMLFNEIDFLDRFEAAAEAGFKGSSISSPTPSTGMRSPSGWTDSASPRCCTTCRPATGKAANAASPATLSGWASSRRAWAGRSSTPPPRLQAAQLPGRHRPRRRGRGQGPRHLHRQPGLCRTQARGGGIRLLIEPINTYDIPGFYLSRTAQAVDIIEAVGSDNLYVQYDIYHAQRMEGELANTIVKYLPRIAHMQLADNPGRNEPGTGEINFAWLFRHIDNSGYDGWIGCEYKPAAGTREGLGWIEALTA